jgi:hypothetical protein
MVDNLGPTYASDEARETIARDAAFGDHIDTWADARRNQRQQEAPACGRTGDTTDTTPG